MKILIIGGTGAFGAFYADLFAKNGFEVGISSRDAEKAKKFCEEKGYLCSSDPSNFDIVLLSTPNESTPALIKEIGPKIKKGSLLVDFCSVKTFVAKELIALSKERSDIEIASIHPMHGPRVETITGYPIIFIPIKTGEKYNLIKEFFEEMSGNIIKTTPENHDKTLSIVQGLTHYSQFVSAAVIKELGMDIKETMKLSSPNYSLFLSLMSRVLLQNPELYCQIQLENPYNAKVREVFTKNAQRLEKLCMKEKCDDLIKEIISEGQSFKDPDAMLIESDRAVNSQKYVINTIKSHIGKKFLVENLLTKTFHYGTIIDVNSKELILLEGSRTTHLSLSKIRATTKEEMLEWKEKNLEKRNLDFSFLVPKETDTKIVEHPLSHTKHADFKLIDEYTKDHIPEGKKSLTFRAYYFDEDKKQKIIDHTIEIIKGLCYEVR